LLGYTDMRSVVKDCVRKGTLSGQSLVARLVDQPRAAQLESYAPRFQRGERAPLEEFFCLAALQLEVATAVEPRVGVAAREVRAWLRSNQQQLDEATVREAVHGLDDARAKAVAEALNAVAGAADPGPDNV
jgi:hypothetical protein